MAQRGNPREATRAHREEDGKLRKTVQNTIVLTPKTYGMLARLRRPEVNNLLTADSKT